MQAKPIVSLIVLALAPLLALAACAEEGTLPPPSPTLTLTPSPTSAPSPTPAPGAELPIAVATTADKREYRADEDVVMTIAITNRSEQPVALGYTSSQRYDFRVVDAAGREVWRWAEDKLFAQVIGQESLGPGESLQYSETWDQTDPQGEPLPSGEYTLEGTSPFCRTPDEFTGCNTAWTEGPQIALSAGGRY